MASNLFCIACGMWVDDDEARFHHRQVCGLCGGNFCQGETYACVCADPDCHTCDVLGLCLHCFRKEGVCIDCVVDDVDDEDLDDGGVGEGIGDGMEMDVTRE